MTAVVAHVESGLGSTPTLIKRSEHTLEIVSDSGEGAQKCGQIFGAVSATKITYSGANMNVHYDTSLRYATFGGVDQPYSVTDWRELPVDEQATMP